MKIFLYSSVYSCHLFLISSASVKVHAFSVLYRAHLCMKWALGVSNFLEEISSLSHAIGSYSLVTVCRLCIAVASFVVEDGLQGMQASLQHTGLVVAAPGLWRTDSVVVAHSLSCCMACGIFPDQRSNPWLLHWQADSLPLSQRATLKFSF